MITNQGYIFLIFIATGMLIGFLFDFFRILRRTFKTTDIITYIQDFLFWILTGIIILYSIFTFNNGEIRLFLFLGITIGIIAYITFLSSYVIKINVAIINFIKKIIKIIFKFLVIPINLIYKIFKKIFYKPISFITINFRKFFRNLYKKISLNLKNNKLLQNNVKN